VVNGYLSGTRCKWLCIWSSWCYWQPVFSCFIKLQIGLSWCRFIQVVLEKSLLNDRPWFASFIFFLGFFQTCASSPDRSELLRSSSTPSYHVVLVRRLYLTHSTCIVVQSSMQLMPYSRLACPNHLQPTLLLFSLCLKSRLHDATCCQTGCQTALTTGWTTGCIVYTNIQPVVKSVW